MSFLGQKAPSGAQMLVSGAWGARNQHFKISGFFFLPQRLSFLQYLAALAAKFIQKIAKNRQQIAFLAIFGGQNQENEGFKILDSGIPKFSRRRPTQPSRPVAFQQETAFHTPINPIFGPARGQIFQKMRVSARRALTQARLSSRDQAGC